MKFSDLVNKRESVRRYSPEPVPRDLVDRCLDAARLAPSACNSQPWSFIVVDDVETIKEIVKESMSGIYGMNAFVRTAPVLIVVVTEQSTYIARLGGQIRSVRYNLIDIGIACEHLVLQAVDLGLGTCWLGWFNDKAVKRVLGLPKSSKVDVMICLGYPAESAKPRQKRRQTLAEIRRYFST